MEKRMETSIVDLGSSRDNGKENGIGFRGLGV